MNYLATARTLPDTGASCDCVSEAFVKQHGLKVLADPDGDIDLSAAEGDSIEVSGTTELSILGPQGTYTKSLALVCPRLSNTLLLSWGSQKKLRMLHKNWPFQILNQEQANTAQVRYTIPPHMQKREEKKPKNDMPWPPENFLEKLKQVC